MRAIHAEVSRALAPNHSATTVSAYDAYPALTPVLRYITVR